MQERVTTSFIPKESLTTQRGPLRGPRGTPLGLINLVAGVILVVALIASGGVFLFKQYTLASISSKQDSLARQRAAFEPATIQELSRIDKRLTAAEELLKKHVALSLLFTDLESRTVANVRFNDFSYEPATEGRIKVLLRGTARSFNAVALQADNFSKSVLIQDPIFSNVNLDQSGNVIFNFEAVVALDRMRYAAAALGAPSAPELEAPLEQGAQSENVQP